MFRKVLVGDDGTPSGRDAVVLARALAVASEPDVVHAKAGLSSGRDLCHAIADARADLLVLGSSRRIADGCAGAGRTGRQVLHGAGCAIALAAHGIATREFALRRVVVGVDRSPESAAALTAARALADASGAQLTAVAVVDDRLPATVAPAGMAIELVQWDELVGAHREQTERLLAELVERMPALATELRVGEPAEELATVAAGADLLVVGSRRWGPFARLVVGSTGEELVRESPCSLLLVPRPAEEAVGAHLPADG